MLETAREEGWMEDDTRCDWHQLWPLTTVTQTSTTRGIQHLALSWSRRGRLQLGERKHARLSTPRSSPFTFTGFPAQAQAQAQGLSSDTRPRRLFLSSSCFSSGS
ncbi:hypothetical protein TESG_07379 [Trichophyton tonsurans CBS 112818]|uniref:Uncharacterized protein n=1 Tax=Trichophyton tonsurans (strain CBS 112818) TaxID=647933 RepID=F2S906_TRIT1|nr:hypothetical protein TESG_07379 [Trichophyton tonsurans CBS 112818]